MLKPSFWKLGLGGLLLLVLAAPGATGGTRAGFFDLVFESTSPGTPSQIAVSVGAKGRGVRLTQPKRNDSSPSTLPSGDLALASDETGHWQIFVTGPNGEGRRPLFPSQRSQFSPAWSPNGEKVAFESNRKGRWQISVASVHGNKAFAVTHNRINHFDPAWSPNGKYLVYTSVRKGRSDLYVTLASPINHPRRLTRTKTSEFDPSWSPDGKLIAFDRLKEGDYDIWTVKAVNGAPVSHLTYGPNNDTAPTWSPDGEKIAFESDRTDDYDIWIVNADGSGLHDVSRNPASIDLVPTWREHMSTISTVVINRSITTNHGCDTLQPGQHVGNKIYGTSGVDWLCGTPGKDRIYGEQDADHINGKYGRDYVYGGAGGDGILAQDGLRDRLYGGEPGASDSSRVDWALADKTLDKRSGIDALKR